MLRVRLVRFLASHLLPKRDREFILGDLEELYHEARTRGERGAANRYVWDALTSIVTGRRRAHTQSQRQDDHEAERRLPFQGAKRGRKRGFEIT